MYYFSQWHNTFHIKIFRRSLNYVVNEICKLFVRIWRRINKIANSIKSDSSKV
uniref:Uncharacterized protein n=1 Tax=Solanum lycopersicum TaxID=4081 RepID=A0A3Q7I9T4_SOLLC